MSTGPDWRHGSQSTTVSAQVHGIWQPPHDPRPKHVGRGRRGRKELPGWLWSPVTRHRMLSHLPRRSAEVIVPVTVPSELSGQPPHRRPQPESCGGWPGDSDRPDRLPTELGRIEELRGSCRPVTTGLTVEEHRFRRLLPHRHCSAPPPARAVHHQVRHLPHTPDRDHPSQGGVTCSVIETPSSNFRTRRTFSVSITPLQDNRP
jgi:hypothetical protein